MTYFPHTPRLRPFALRASRPMTVRPTLQRDILWNQPVFQAPTLPNPRLATEPMPFRAQRITQRRAHA